MLGRSALKFSAESLGMFWKIHTSQPRPFSSLRARSANFNDCVKLVGVNSTITEKTKVVHSLIHISSERPFRTPNVSYASKIALDTIVRVKGDEARRKMRDLLASCEGNHLTASLCGYILEPYAVSLLDEVESLTAGNSSTATRSLDHPRSGLTSHLLPNVLRTE